MERCRVNSISILELRKTNISLLKSCLLVLHRQGCRESHILNEIVSVVQKPKPFLVNANVLKQTKSCQWPFQHLLRDSSAVAAASCLPLLPQASASFDKITTVSSHGVLSFYSQELQRRHLNHPNESVRLEQ